MIFPNETDEPSPQDVAIAIQSFLPQIANILLNHNMDQVENQVNYTGSQLQPDIAASQTTMSSPQQESESEKMEETTSGQFSTHPQFPSSSPLGIRICYDKRCLESGDDEKHPSPEDEALSNISMLSDRLKQMRFYSLVDENVLENVIRCQRMTLDSSPTNSPLHVQALISVAEHLYIRFERKRDKSDLDEIIALLRIAIGLQHHEYPNRPVHMHLLGKCLQLRFLECSRGKRKPQDLDEAIEHLRNCVQAYPGQFKSACVLTECYGMRFVDSQRLSDLEEAINYGFKALHLLPSNHPNRRLPLELLGVGFESRYQLLGDLHDRRTAIEMTKQAILLYPPGNLRVLPLTAKYIDYLDESFQEQEDVPDVTFAIDQLKDCLEWRGLRGKNRVKALNSLGKALRLRFRHDSSTATLEESVAYHQRALALQSPDDPERSDTLRCLITAYTSSHSDEGLSDQYLSGMMRCARELMRLHPHDSHKDSGILRLMAIMQDSFFKSQGRIQDLEEAISLLRDGALMTNDDKARHTLVFNLACALMNHFNWTGNLDSLEEAITQLRQTVVPGCNEPRDQASSLNMLGVSLMNRFKHYGDHNDLEESIHNMRTAAMALKTDGWKAMSNLAAALITRYEHCGELQDLDEGITTFREVMHQKPADEEDEAMALNNLGAALMMRYHILNNAPDLHEAIPYIRRSLSLRQVGNPSRAATLNNLAKVLELRDSVGDMAEAIACLREVLQIRPSHHPERSTNLHNLAGCLQKQTEGKGLEMLNEALDCNLQGLVLRPLGHPKHAESLVCVAKSFSDRFRAQQDVRDLDEAILYGHNALSISSSNPMGANWLGKLASDYMTYSTLPGHEDKAQQALTLYDMATDFATSSVHDRFHVSLEWVAASQLDVSSLLPGYKKCLKLADRYLLVKSSILARRRLALPQMPLSLASDAASCAIEAGQIETAVEFLEQGRTLLWTQMGRYRTSLDSLRFVDPGLAGRLEQLNRELETSSMTISQDQRSTIAIEEEAIKYRQLSAEWDTTVEKIRQLNDFENFLKVTPYALLKQGSAHGPVIIINISQRRSDAIIIHQSRSPVILPIHNARPEDIDRLSSKFSDALLPSTSARNRKTMVIAVLRILWEDIVAPVVNKLQELGVSPGSRIWWCPTYKLSSLPLHAAGQFKGKHSSLVDLYISSYTPTLTALNRSSSALTYPQRSHPAPQFLLVAQASAPNQPHIKSVLNELKMIKQIIPSANVLEDEEGGPEAVLATLQDHHWVHFACHGTQDLEESFQSRFHLKAKCLSLLDIIQSNLPNAEFAYSAACHSAAGDITRPDEIIHLAAGLQFAGFKSVIGTLYAMADVDGPNVAEEVYRYMFRRSGGENADFRDAAVALNHATKKLREMQVPVERWINFIHIGA
ncbi:hypothetical protein FRC03_012673 [Tulasnella sp. 419]|nr:hypothetical protein FRC03_012673 [Tulasnella sp. 419]